MTHRFDRCACGHLRQTHRPGSCLGSSFKRGGTGRQVGDTHSSVCPCRGFTGDGTRFVVDPDPKVARAVKAGQAPASYEPIVCSLSS